MKKLILPALALAAGVGLALAGGRLLAGPPRPVHTKAMWKSVYRTPSGLVAGADVIVEARHVSALPGRVVGEGRDATPFTNNTFEILSVLKGELTGSEILVEQTGGLLSSGAVLDIDDGGPFVPGASYLLFLKEGEDGSYYQINHQARYRIDGETLEGVDPTDRVVAALHGAELDDVRGAVQDRLKVLEY